jgi:hypothetical protein
MGPPLYFYTCAGDGGHQKQNDAPYYLKILFDEANKPLNWAYEPLNGFKLSFSPFFTFLILQQLSMSQKKNHTCY